MISERMLKTLSRQVNAELARAYLYLSMSAYYQDIDLPGFAQWIAPWSSKR